MISPERRHLTPISDRFHLYRAPERARTATFAGDVRTGLTAARKYLPPKYFYDELGSAIFESICVLPEYYLTRTEAAILERCADEMVRALGGEIEFVEFGSGSARKTRSLIGAALARQPEVEYHPIDISPAALEESSAALVSEYDRLTVRAYASDYFDVLESAMLSTSKRVLALFLGSNIGNYAPADARMLLRAMSAAFKPGDGLLLGADLKKDAAILERAYNDPTGVTASFNKNVLARINRELGGHFDLDAFAHAARYDAASGSVDSFLVAQRGCEVAIDALDLRVRFDPWETIHSESSHKFDAADIASLAADSGFRVERRWTDDAQRFAISLLVIV